MRKAANIIYIISAILAIISAIGCFCFGGFMLSADAATIQQVYNEAGMSSSATLEVFTQIWQSVGVYCIVFGVFYVLSAVFGFIGSAKALHSDGKAIHIFNIVLGAISLSPLFLLGAIFGTIGASTDR